MSFMLVLIYKMNKLIALFVLVAGIALVEPHGHMSVPLARTSVFRNPALGGQQPFWWDDNGVWCGNVQQNLQYSTCGRCGDAPGNTHANQGGRYDKGIITGTYTAGSVSIFFIICYRHKFVKNEILMTRATRQYSKFNLCFSLIDTFFSSGHFGRCSHERQPPRSL